MKEEIKYCVFDTKGNPAFWTLSGTRKESEVELTSFWKFEKWSKWYRKGWRIKKVKVKIEIL